MCSNASITEILGINDNNLVILGKKKENRKNKITNVASDSEFNWNTELILGREENEYTVIYHRCGLCALGK
ncbi:MAG: hypothetical protein ACTTIJ_06520 [Dialister pneumosintes]